MVTVLLFMLRTLLTTVTVPIGRAKRDVDSAYIVCTLPMACRLEPRKCASVLRINLNHVPWYIVLLLDHIYTSREGNIW